MSRIISYPYDDSIKAKDAWVGTDEASRQTKQYTAEALAEYLNISGSISIIGQMTYKYGTTSLNGIGTLAIFGGGPDIVAFSAVAKLTLSNQDISNQRVVEFLDLLVGSDILIAEQGAISTFGYYSIDSYAINATDSNYYDLGVTFKSGNGSMRSDRIYEAQNFVLANDATQSPWNTVPDGISYTAANVGIGTTTPGHKLEVVGGNVHFQNTESSNTFLDVQGDDANAYIRAHSGSNSVWLYQGGSSSYLQAQAGSTLRLGSGTSNLVITNTSGEVMRISGSNVGIGTTNPSEKLEVSGGIKGDALFLSDGGDYEVKLLTGNITTNHTFTFPDTEGTLAITSDIPSASQWDDVTGGINYANGNVGIGTDSPNVSIQAESNSSQDKRTLRLAYDSSYYFDIAQLGAAGVHYNAVQAPSGGHKFKIDGSEKMTIAYSGNVGIGTTSPSEKLEVSGSRSKFNGILVGENRTDIQFEGDGNLAVGNNDWLILKEGGQEVMRAGGSSKNVGIGTTSPSAKLHVAGATVIDGFTTGSAMALNVGGSNNAQIRTRHIEGKSYNSSSLGELNLNYYSNHNVSMAVGGGNVGIGTTSPSTKLEIADTTPTLRLTDTRNLNVGDWDDVSLGKLQFKTSDTSSPGARVLSEIEAYSGTGAASAPESQLRFKTATNLDTSATTKMTISAAGNVGIGTTTPTRELDVIGQIQASDRVISNQLQARSSFGVVFKNSSGSDLMLMSNDGKLGIGTTSPNKKLHVNSGTINEAARFESADVGAFIEFKDSGTTDLPIIGAVGNNFDIRTGGSTSVRATSAGNVGIGTDSPIVKLDVVGTARFADVSPRMVLQETGNAKDFSLKINTDGRLSFLNDDLASEVLTIKQNGNVGIGTTSPTSTLHVVGTQVYEGYVKFENTVHAIRLDLKSSSHTANIYMDGTGGVISGGGLIFNTPTSRTHFMESGTPKMSIISGNVGIGTTSPGQKLEVDGQVLSDGYRLAAMQTAPATRNSAGTLGEIVIDGNHIYVCYATDSWSRVALDTSW